MKKILSIVISIFMICSYITVAYADYVPDNISDKNSDIFLEVGNNPKTIRFSAKQP